MVSAVTVFAVLFLYIMVIDTIHRTSGMKWRLLFGGSILIVFAALFLSRYWIICHTRELTRIGMSQMTEFAFLDDLNGVEKISVGLVAAFQTFSLDASYALFIAAGKLLLEQHGSWGRFLAEVYGGLVSLLNVAAPLLGGAVLLDVLTDVFPGIRLRFFSRRRAEYVFSELNQAALCLAKDLVDKKQPDKQERNYVKLQEFWLGADRRTGICGGWLRRMKARIPPLLVFTDAYVNEKEEAGAELIEQAKALGAVCLREDLLHLNLKRSAFLSYFFVDDKEENNISALDELLGKSWVSDLICSTPRGAQPLQEAAVKVRCYVFTTGVGAEQMIANVKSRRQVETANLIIRVIEHHKTMAQNLMSSVPLFDPLLKNESGLPQTRIPDSDHPGALKVAIIGDGAPAAELFKAVFWCGQMSRYRLQIRLITSRDEADCRFLKQLKLHAPEILKTCSGPWEDPALLRAGGGKVNPAYADVRVCPCDFDSSALFDRFGDVVDDTDYFIVTAGTDERNIRIAQSLYLHLVRTHTEARGRRLIACAVSDPTGALAAQQQSEEYGTELIPFGSVDSVFSCRNVFMSGFQPNRLQADNRFSIREYLTDKDEIYLSASHTARRMHLSYRLFDLGLLQTRREAPGRLTANACAWDLAESAEEKLLRMLAFSEQAKAGCLPEAASMNEQQREAKRMAEQFAWVEHRRWNAYMRTLGFCAPDPALRREICRRNAERNLKACQRKEAGYKPNCKDISRKLHACLVESRFGALFDDGAADVLRQVTEDVNAVYREVFRAAHWDEAELKFKNYLYEDLPDCADEFPGLSEGCAK